MAHTPIEVLCCYAHEDEPWLRRLETHLALLKYQGMITTWYDRLITAGADWKKAIDTRLESASVILLLISADFLASDYCYNIEMKRALERHKLEEALIIPILLRPVDWQKSPFASLQLLPTNARPVTSWKNRDAALADIVAGLRRALEAVIDREIEKHVKELDKFIRREIDNTTFDIQALAELGLVGFPSAPQMDSPLAYTSRRPQWFARTSEQFGATKEAREFRNIDECLAHYRGRLLLLGEPGSGKTTTLLRFAQRRIVGWQKGLGNLLPIYSPIYTWNGSIPLLNWLSQNTGLGVHTLQRLINSNTAIFLLDGLDELEITSRRVEFIKRVNELPEVPLIMTCRSKDYDTLLEESDQQVALNGAATLSPLQTEQVKNYLSNLPDLWIAAQNDSELLEVIRNPLLLTLFIVGYQEKPQDVKSLRNLGYSPYLIRNRLFETFIEKRYDFEKSRSTQNLAYTLEELYEMIGEEIFLIIGNAVRWVFYQGYWDKIGGFFLLLPTPEDKSVPLGEFIEKLHLVVKRKFTDDPSKFLEEYYRFRHKLFFDYFAYVHWTKMSRSDNPNDRYSAVWAASWFEEWGDDALVFASNDRDVSVRRKAFRKMYEQKRWSALQRAGAQLDPQERDRIKNQIRNLIISPEFLPPDELL